ncbi:hypothetical protein THER_1906 [Thermodesulfovibrio sp. N1]|nr:hypothetical protein THER_1906 [Thermodesulfovibrio sp. N1]
MRNFLNIIYSIAFFILVDNLFVSYTFSLKFIENKALFLI